MVPGYGRDDGDIDRGFGANLVPGVWSPPDSVPPEWASAARLWLRAAEAEPDDQTVTPRDLQKWLATLLGNLASGAGTAADEIDMRVRLLSVAVDDRAAKHFSKDALKLAWERFNFIPTAHELMAFFDDMESDERTQAQRLMVICDVAAKPPRPRPPGIDIERSMALNRERADRERAELAAMVEERYGPLPPFPEMQPGESRAAYVDRMRDYRAGLVNRPTQAPKAPTVQDPEAVKEAQRKFRDAKEHGPPPPPEPDDRLAGMTPDPTTPEDP